MVRAGLSILLGAVFLLAGGWWVSPASSQSTVTAPLFREVNSHGIYTLLSTATTAATPKLANALSTTVTTVDSDSGVLDSYFCWNPNSAVAYVQIFDIAGTVTLGTSTPKWSIGIPPTASGNLANINLTFANAIKVAATTTATGSSAPTTALDCNFGYR